jgi:hypothetical protein
MTTDTLSPAARMTLHEVLTDLGFPSVLDMDDTASMHDYYLTIADAWGACDQTDEDVDATVRARDAIFNAYCAFTA